jgi:hypothetical protein
MYSMLLPNQLCGERGCRRSSSIQGVCRACWTAVMGLGSRHQQSSVLHTKRVSIVIPRFLSSRHVALQKRAGQLKVRNPPATEACYALFIRAVDVVALRLASDRCVSFLRRLLAFAPRACNLILPHQGRYGMAAEDGDRVAMRLASFLCGLL